MSHHTINIQKSFSLHTFIEKKIPTMKLFDRHGKKIDTIQLKKEYAIIKNYLTHHYTEKDIVAIRLEKDYQYLLTILACMSVGITYIPLNIDWPDERIMQIKELSQCHIIEEGTINFKEETILPSYTTFYKNEILYIIFTSGSTGVPKGVKIKREGYKNFLIWCDSYFTNITSYDRLLLTTDFTFDISLVDISLLLTKNLTLYISNFNNNIYKMLFELEKYQITAHSTVPYNYSMVMHEDVYDKADISSLKHVILGGARFPYNLYYQFKEKMSHCDIYNFYGPTEATIYCSIHKLTYNEEEELHNNNITIGKPFYNNFFSIIDDELLISGKQLMDEYLHNKKKTEEVLVTIDGKKHYRSGDVVFKNKQQNYFIVGRKDDTIKVVGYRVNLSDIDSYILTLNYINNAATIALDNEEGEHDLVSYIILNEKGGIDAKKIRKDLKNIMPSYQIAKYIKIVNEFPLNNSNKICKLTLKKMFLKNK